MGLDLKKWCAAIGVLFWIVVSANAHSGERVFPITCLTDEMLAEIRLDDGLIEEWFDLIGEPGMTLLDFEEERGDLPLDPSDLDFRIWLAWHNDPARFYVAFVASDDVYINTHDFSGDGFQDLMFENDMMMLAIDGDHSGGAGFAGTPDDWLNHRGNAQHYEAIASTVSGPTLDDPRTRNTIEGFPWTVLPPYGDSGGGVAGEAPTISVIELYVTPFDRWDSDFLENGVDNVVSDLAAGQTVGFAVAAVDQDHSEPEIWVPRGIEPDNEFDSLTLDMLTSRADSFLDGILLPADPAGGTAVGQATWGRIKAALKIEGAAK
ncbi:MAG: hypothetical protein OXH50_16590 [Gemmatimonadetes bacterium]|nr:hypothetical protein [Gemmatimonadota bacterium]